ncbi:EGF-like domain, peptidase M8, leishmanolysin, frizzled domain protein [Tanacetum coccineum]|uniref:EGF-like domain, peptidase M8, leishmanolysin, frizzled domain protein n=1 Tax=Tanacetum coccineum TaxID=301880 RepID=A0ABQ5DBE5_9ASTR
MRLHINTLIIAMSLQCSKKTPEVSEPRYDAHSGGEREIQITMLELLNQFDGFNSRGDVKVILATNKIESLNPALIRPGRIDRKIEFPLPDIKTRRRILQKTLLFPYVFSLLMHSRSHYEAFLDNFNGLELEDGGRRRMSGSHWEKKLLMNEIMTGLVDTRTVVSKMTLALLEDSGWYEANNSMMARLDWGHNQGTEFVTTPCNL